MSFLEFEKPIAELESKIAELRSLGTDDEIVNIDEEVERLQGKIERMLTQTYAKLTPAQKVQVARHPGRPHCKDYVAGLFTEFTPLAGDRLFAEDQAIIGGLARFKGRSCVVIGQEKGSDTETRVRHNFGMPKPEGYRKAQRLMNMAEQFNLPIITFIDTSGAYPGIEAEERGQAEAIAKSIDVGLNVKVPIISVVIGEGGSGGAIAIGTGDSVMMLEHAIYSVISPEGCASILWRSATAAAEAAAALQLTAQDLLQLKVIDRIIEEPLGGAHRNHAEMIKRVGNQISQALKPLEAVERDLLKIRRRERFLAMGQDLAS
ncbi:MAG: acetyl-CoA carboxylase carboxyl transferase subunit alpha [Alphaproteobacteria bacterium]|nr:acetyl-CoA carboxylase carboxyl transferase subunit alpha [Alphaproteobacteria bacterium]MAS46700.1 acetyl-CoA carboxylase carboxyl transferase subunit alpha [Alphaproteobacteria bacterium]MAX94795.1 acetyl-CoA carboxylase carboxyl transferase subunit alpha [Alphaproteobacteria bacterium]MBN53752.1 acetyl-CoA carboxylase carboxyl transferase subunit alpha [Alphaproteobacteria bacterium]OUT41722.1 MAG: acetyl-CoA carboxylase carboxyl transferase subunit alpha [Micavibrio sp. TMED2]|tara:strand:+ start:2709 stop:3665 length:957 start_codon:yes stop_codon:yes gene_type:complete